MNPEYMAIKIATGGLAFIGLCIIALIFCLMMMKKNDNTCAMHMKIIYAIYKYRLQCIEQRETAKVNYDDMESYERTLFRLWDWGYTHILPKEKFEIIRPYIDLVEVKNDAAGNLYQQKKE